MLKKVSGFKCYVCEKRLEREKLFQPNRKLEIFCQVLDRSVTVFIT